MFNGREERVNRAPVFLTLSDGSGMTVSIRMPLSNRIADALNNGDVFIDAMTGTGQQIFIAKASVRSVRSAMVPKVDQMDIDNRAAAAGNFDPYAVLKIGRDSSRDDIKHAYHRMARLYHPDRISSYDLPEEMKEYARNMLVRINLAFEQLGAD